MNTVKRFPSGYVRVGNYQGAQEDIANHSVEKMAVIYDNHQLQQEAIRIRDKSPYGKYVHNDAVARVNDDKNRGIIAANDGKAIIDRYKSAMQNETRRFRETVRPQEVSPETDEYFQQRKQIERRNKGLG